MYPGPDPLSSPPKRRRPIGTPQGARFSMLLLHQRDDDGVADVEIALLDVGLPDVYQPPCLPRAGSAKHSQTVRMAQDATRTDHGSSNPLPGHDPYRLAAAHSPPWPHSALRGQRGYPEASAGRGGHDCRPSRLAGGVVLRRHTSFHTELGRLTTQVIDAVAYPVSWAFRWTQRAGVNHTRLWTPPGLEGQLPQG